MKIRYTAAALALALAPYSVSHALDIGGLVGAGSKVVQAATLSDADIKTLSDKACAQSDSQEKIAAPGSKYDARLQKLAKSLGASVNGQPANYKVYITKDVNAWAMANGCIRVYSGLMDMMNDDEVLGVVGHEIGHVALGHSKKAMQTAYTVSAARDAADAAGGDGRRAEQVAAGQPDREVHQRAVLAIAGKRCRRLLVRPDPGQETQCPWPGHGVPEAGRTGRRQERYDEFASVLGQARAAHRRAHRQGQAFDPASTGGKRGAGIRIYPGPAPVASGIRKFPVKWRVYPPVTIHFSENRSFNAACG